MSAVLLTVGMVIGLVLLFSVMVWPWLRSLMVRSTGRVVADVKANVAEREGRADG